MQLYHERDGLIPYLDGRDAERLHGRRQELLKSLEGRVRESFKGSKLHIGELSEGCRICGEGGWSCLFLNATCNGNCFFCPGSMSDAERPPYVEWMYFLRPVDYAQMVQRLGYRGVSFSGGEPFLTPDLLFDHARAIRERVGEGIYMWVYTNGLAADAELLEAAARAGIDEVRFNIAACDYEVGAVALARDLVKTVTVEIPAIPEDLELARRALEELAQIGVDHVNLHQLMICGDNSLTLLKRGYHYLPSDTPPVVESELAALELLGHVLDGDYDLAVQYCSQPFKERWQNRASILRAAPLVMKPSESQSEPGWVRRLWLAVDHGPAQEVMAKLKEQGLDERSWEYNHDQGALYLHPSLLGQIECPAEGRFYLQYFGCMMAEASGTPTEITDYHEVELAAGVSLAIRLFPVSGPIMLEGSDLRSMAELIKWYECIPPGLSDFWVSAIERVGAEELERTSRDESGE